MAYHETKACRALRKRCLTKASTRTGFPAALQSRPVTLIVRQMNRIRLSILCCFAFTVACATTEQDREAPDYTITALWIQAGGYRPTWEITLDSWGEFELKGGYGGIHEDLFRFSGTGYLTQENLERVDVNLNACPLQALPESLEPEISSFHKPEIRLTLCTPNECITRGVYDPRNVPESEKKNCYLEIWDSIWSPLQFAPEWVRLPNKGFNRTPESSGAAKPVEFRGGAG